MPGGRLKDVPAAVEEALTKKYGAPANRKWVLSPIEYGIYLDYSVIDAKKLSRAEVVATVADVVRALPHVFRAYTRDNLLRGELQNDFVGKHVTNGFFAQRAPDVAYIPEPYWMDSKTGTTHGTPFGYDTHVPVIFIALHRSATMTTRSRCTVWHIHETGHFQVNLRCKFRHGPCSDEAPEERHVEDRALSDGALRRVLRGRGRWDRR